jgi:SAM-dependent methyltransferase
LHRILDLGCGRNKTPGAIGVDSKRTGTAADLIADLDSPFPFADNSFDDIRAIHVVEHLRDIVKFMAEVHRVAKPGGTVRLITPHYTDFSSWRDPTHRWHLNTFYFRYFSPVHEEGRCYTTVKLKELASHVELARLWKALGIQYLVNHLAWCRRFWEMYLCFVVRGKQMEFTFEVVK